jgi:hypothetical protein
MGNSILSSLPCSLPPNPLPSVVDPNLVAKEFVLLPLTQEKFVKDAVWRDTFALTGSSRTFYGSDSILAAWSDTSTSATNFEISPNAHAVNLPAGVGWIELNFTFRTSDPSCRCEGIISLVFDDGWKIWVLRTILQGLERCSDIDTLEPHKENLKNPDCLIVGAGQAGLSVAGRLKALGVSYLVVDTNNNVGDNWKNRYDSAKCMLHTL